MQEAVMAHAALQAFLAPGNAFCTLVHARQGDDRMMIHTLVNMLVWNLVLVIAAFLIFT
jgi:hypothetical protein